MTNWLAHSLTDKGNCKDMLSHIKRLYLILYNRVILLWFLWFLLFVPSLVFVPNSYFAIMPILEQSRQLLHHIYTKRDEWILWYIEDSKSSSWRNIKILLGLCIIALPLKAQYFKPVSVVEVCLNLHVAVQDFLWSTLWTSQHSINALGKLTLLKMFWPKRRGRSWWKCVLSRGRAYQKCALSPTSPPPPSPWLPFTI